MNLKNLKKLKTLMAYFNIHRFYFNLDNKTAIAQQQLCYLHYFQVSFLYFKIIHFIHFKTNHTALPALDQWP